MSLCRKERVMSISGIGSVQTYIYNTQTGKLSTKDGSTDEFVDYFNGTLSGESSESLNGYDLQKKCDINNLIDVKNGFTKPWFNPDINEYEITCEIVNGEEASYSVNGNKILTVYTALDYLPEEVNEWSAKSPFKTHQSKAYDPATNSMNIAVGDVFDLGNGYKLRVWEDCVKAVGYGTGSADNDEKIRHLEYGLSSLIHFADQQWFSSTIRQQHTPMLLSFLRELGIDTSREFTLNGTKCIVKNGEIQESGNKWVVPSSVHNKALQRYEEWLSQPLSAHKESSLKA